MSRVAAPKSSPVCFAPIAIGRRAKARVLHYLCSEVRGGIEEHALSLLARLPARGFRPYLAAPPGLLSMMGAELEAAGVHTLALRRSSVWDFRDAAAFVAVLRLERIAVVHSHLFVGSMFASPLARLAGVPAVVETFHLPEVWRLDKPLKRSFWLDRQVARCVDRYIAVSAAAARHLAAHKRIPAHKVRTIRNGRDLARFRPPSAAETAAARARLGVGGAPVVVVVGRLEPQKGHALMIRAAQILVRSLPSLRVIFVGGGSLEGELKARCESAGLARAISFAGYRPDPEAVLAAADVAVLPSRYEGLPLAAIEALAMARPLVATDVEGTREVVVDGHSGLLVPPGDAAALARAVERLLRLPLAAQQLAARGRRRAERQFDLRRQVDQTVSLYCDVLAANRAHAETGLPAPCGGIVH